ncbi:MAG: aminodeoxychorismate/anthranilate synthase component II [Candidatus Thermoplasmatota archaeon]|nr:aminodeoxychorismate/anthranilate synthase component II [Candidatus Thermoplasmatota archaeon]
MQVLIIDNYDSFVFNIKQAVEKLGHSARLVENDRVTTSDIHEADRIIISPGPGNPLLEGDRGLTDRVLKLGEHKVLGICFGHQLLGMMLGCNIRIADRIMHGEIDHIKHETSPLYSGIPDVFEAVRYHSLVIDPCERVIVDAVSLSDGSIMGFHTPDMNVFGIQYHPESFYTREGEAIIRNFLEA